MSELGILRQAFMRLSGGFVIAVHDIPPQRLADLLDGLSPARPISLSELVQRRKDDKSCSGLFAITVDDGVGDNVRALARLFRARGWPATFYLPTEYLDTGEPMPFQRWWWLKPLLPRKAFKLKSGMVDLSRPGAIDALSARIERAWYCQRPEAYLPLTLELAEAVARETTLHRRELQGPAPISWTEVEELSHDELIGFESHGVTHTAMSALSEEQIDFEMSISKDIVSEHTGRPCRHFCYPFGSPLSIGGIAPKVAQRYYDSAATMTLGPVAHADALLLPRIPLYPKNSLLIAWLKVLLKCTVLGSSKAAAGASTKTPMPDALPKKASGTGRFIEN